MNRKKIEIEHIKGFFEVGKMYFNKMISREDGVSRLISIGMSQGSASDAIYVYKNFIGGKIYRRTTSAKATEYFLKRIFAEDGISGLRNAVSSLSKHLEYYDNKSKSTSISRRIILTKYLKIVHQNESEFTNPNEYPVKELDSSSFNEGAVKTVLVNAYERNRNARNQSIKHHGCKCLVCGFNFLEKFGEIGIGFIHVHHIIEMASIKEQYEVDPINDLVPVCPNCHVMLHKRKPAYSIKELKEVIRINQLVK